MYWRPSISYKRQFFCLHVFFWSEIAFLTYTSSSLSSHWSLVCIYFSCRITHPSVIDTDWSLLSLLYRNIVFDPFLFICLVVREKDQRRFSSSPDPHSDVDGAPSSPSTPPPFTVVTLHCFLLSGLRCHPGWTGNRCHVKEKPFPSTAAPEAEDAYLGNERAHLPPRLCRKSLGWIHRRSAAVHLRLLLCPQTPSMWASPSDCCCSSQVSPSAFSPPARKDATLRECWSKCQNSGTF